jgi:hypothetical protein
MNGFVERIGGVLVAPRSTMGRLAAGEARAGDIAWLLVARVVAGELDQLARAWVLARQIGIAFGLQSVLGTFTAVLPDLCGILVAGMVMGLFAPRTTRAFDLAAYAWVPYLAVTMVGALYFTAAAEPPSPRALDVITGIGVAWAIVVWTLGLVATRKPTTPAATPPATPAPTVRST